MSQLFHHRFQFILSSLYLWWTSFSVSSQELNNYQNSVKDSGLVHFFYQQSDYPKGCLEARNRCSTNKSGVYLIKPDGYPRPFEVYCDHTTETGGWTVIHRLQDSSLVLNRSWSEYKTGFGFLSGDFWLGNDKLSFLTNQNKYELRIDVRSTDNLSFHVTYKSFRISDEYSEYKLISVGEYRGTEDNITVFLCPSGSERAVIISYDCSSRCYCDRGRFSCDDDYQCSSNAICEERNNVLQCYCNEGYIGDGVNCTIDNPPSDCRDIYDRISTESGVYKIKPTTWLGDPFDVYCNMTEGGGWTVFQRRVDGSQDFFLYWADYKDGFGTPDRELWLGNDKLHSLTSQKSYELRIDFVNSLGSPYYANYDSFSIEDESDNYRLRIGTYSGNAGHSLSYNNGQAFSTRDRDNDRYYGNCADGNYNHYLCSYCNYQGAWWYNHCTLSSLNSPFGSDTLSWYNLPGSRTNIKYTEMKVRPT